MHHVSNSSHTILPITQSIKPLQHQISPGEARLSAVTWAYSPYTVGDLSCNVLHVDVNGGISIVSDSFHCYIPAI